MDEPVVRFDVGGTQFATAKSTLDRHPDCLLTNFLSNENSDTTDSSIFRLHDGTIFIDRDPALFSLIMDFLRSGRARLPEGFKDAYRLREEAAFFQLQSLVDLLPAAPSENGGGYITLGYRGTFAFGRDGQADVKFRKLQRILVHGKATLCREVFGDTLNESRDPGDHDDNDRYTTRLYLKHQCLEKACDAMAEKGFRLLSTCTSGANGLSSGQLMSAGITSVGGNVTRMGRLKQGFFSANDDSAIEQDVMNHHRNSGDLEEQRWAHYTEYVFYRDVTSATTNGIKSELRQSITKDSTICTINYFNVDQIVKLIHFGA